MCASARDWTLLFIWRLAGPHPFYLYSFRRSHLHLYTVAKFYVSTEIRTHIFSSGLIISQLASEREHVTRPIGHSCRSRVQCVPIVTARAGEIDSHCVSWDKTRNPPDDSQWVTFRARKMHRARARLSSPSLSRPRYPFLSIVNFNHVTMILSKKLCFTRRVTNSSATTSNWKEIIKLTSQQFD